MGLNPSTLIMERDQDFPQLPSIPLSSKLDGALTPLCFPSTKAGTKSQSHALAGLGSPWHTFRLGPRAAYKPFATLARRSSQPFRGELSSAHRGPGKAFPLQTAACLWFCFKRKHAFSVSRRKTVKPGQNHPINSTEHDKSGQRAIKELRKPRLPSQTQNS